MERSDIAGAMDYQPRHRLQGFFERAEYEADALFARDLLFTAELAQQISKLGGLALVVGGFARDAVLADITGQPQVSKDVDVEVYGIEFEKLVSSLGEYGKLDLVGASFGIVKVTNPDTKHKLDFSIPREDSKVDKGHKGFQITGNPYMSVAEAARRRDLTINALALDPLSGELIDEYGGVNDLRNRTLRATDTNLFGDDPLRVLRVMQFAGRFGFRVDPATAELCRQLDLTELAAERIGEEWIKLMTKSEKPSTGLAVARDLGVLAQLHPELALLDKAEDEKSPEGETWSQTMEAVDVAAQIVREERLAAEDAHVILFGSLTHKLAPEAELIKRFLHQLKLPNTTVNKIQVIMRDHTWHVDHPDPTDKQLYRFAERLQPANLRLWNLVRQSSDKGRLHSPATQNPVDEMYRRSIELGISEKPADPIVRGRDLITHMQMKPSPQFKTVLDFLYDAQLDNAFKTVEEGIAYYQMHKPDNFAG